MSIDEKQAKNSGKAPLWILESQKIIGIDCEWRPSITKYHQAGVALIQIACKDYVFLIDIIALKDSERLDEILTNIFISDIIIVGMDFKNDMKEISRRVNNKEGINIVS